MIIFENETKFRPYGKGPKNGQRFSANFLNDKNDFKEAFLSNSLTDCPKFQFLTPFKSLLFVYNEIYLDKYCLKLQLFGFK